MTLSPALTVGGPAVFSIGHRHPKVVAAVKEQLDRMPMSVRAMPRIPEAALAELLAQITPGDLQYSFFTNSGTEANEGALKLARLATGRPGIVSADGAFHGKTMGALSASGRESYKEPFRPLLPGFTQVPFGDLEAMGRAVTAQTAAVILEPIQGEGGFVVPAPGFVKGLAELCSEYGILFIADEIQSGMGRAGRWFAIEDEGVVPDLVTSAKSLGGGLPISAVTGRADVMDAVHVGGLGGTYGGNPVAAAAALAVLDQIEREALLERSRTLGERVMARLREMRERHEVIGEVRGRGMMTAIELVADRATKEPLDGASGTAIVRRCLEQGVVILKAGTFDNVIRLLPPLTIDEGLLDEGLDVLDEAMAT